MDSLIKEYSLVLKNENEILEELSEKQKELRTVLTERDWDNLLDLMSEINGLSDTFQKFDVRRDELQSQLTDSDIEVYAGVLSSLRNRLLKCKVENQVISSYVNTTRQFISSVVQEAVPQIRNKNYTKKGVMTQPQTSSVLVDVRR